MFRVHTIETAPEASKPILEGAQKALGFVPNLYSIFAESPALLGAYTDISQRIEQTEFDATERQVVLLTVSFENECTYCVAAHTSIANMQGVDKHVVEAIRNGEPLSNLRLQVLREFTAEVVRKRGWLDEEEVQRFLEAGFNNRQALEVILLVGLKILSNYANHIAKTPLDGAFLPNAWTRPASAGAGF